MAQFEILEGTGEELQRHLKQHSKERFRLIRLPDEQVFPNYEEALAHALNRTPEAIAQARARLLQASKAPRELPEGKTLEDVIMGQWPGDKTDEQILEALEKLS